MVWFITVTWFQRNNVQYTRWAVITRQSGICVCNVILLSQAASLRRQAISSAKRLHYIQHKAIAAAARLLMPRPWDAMGYDDVTAACAVPGQCPPLSPISLIYNFTLLFTPWIQEDVRLYQSDKCTIPPSRVSVDYRAICIVPFRPVYGTIRLLERRRRSVQQYLMIGYWTDSITSYSQTRDRIRINSITVIKLCSNSKNTIVHIEYVIPIHTADADTTQLSSCRRERWSILMHSFPFRDSDWRLLLTRHSTKPDCHQSKARTKQSDVSLSVSSTDISICQSIN